MLHVYLIVRFRRKALGFETTLTWSHQKVAQLVPLALIIRFLKHHGRPIHASYDSSAPDRRRALLRKRQVKANRKAHR